MKYTNKYELPEAFVRVVLNDPYHNGGADFTPTSLDNAPRAHALLKEFHEEALVDVSSRVAAIIGNGAHYIAERAARPGIDLCEERLFTKVTVDGIEYTISAAIDLYETDTRHLMDWKTTKAYAFSKKAGYGKKPSWIAQMNIGAELLRRNGHDPKKLTIIALLKDWSQQEAGSAGCPEKEVIAVEMPIWSSEQVVNYIEERVRILVAATSKTICEPKENWYGRRCGQWCDASAVCEQYQQSLKTGLLNIKAGDE